MWEIHRQTFCKWLENDCSLYACLFYEQQTLYNPNPRIYIKYTCIFISYMQSLLRTPRNCANNDKRNFSRFTLTLNTQHPFFFLSKYKVHIVYASLTHMLSKLKWRKIISQTEMLLRRGYTVDSFNCTFYFSLHSFLVTYKRNLYTEILLL